MNTTKYDPQEVLADPGLVIILADENMLQQVLAVPGPITGPPPGAGPLPFTHAVKTWLDLTVARFVDCALQQVTAPVYPNPPLVCLGTLQSL